MKKKWVIWVQRLLKISQKANKVCDQHEHNDLSEEILTIVKEMAGSDPGMEDPNLDKTILSEIGYPTPKVDVRAVIFKDNKLLLVREEEGTWSLPGGWAEVGESPSENIIREVLEETGYSVKAIKIIGIYDRNKHHPPYGQHLYKIYFECEILDSINKQESEFQIAFFDSDNLPQLSEERVNREQILRFFLNSNTNFVTEFD